MAVAFLKTFVTSFAGHIASEAARRSPYHRPVGNGTIQRPGKPSLRMSPHGNAALKLMREKLTDYRAKLGL